MKTTSMWICGAMLAAASTLAVAERPGATTRQERIDTALADYRAGQNGTPSGMMSPHGMSPDCMQTSDGGTFARAEAAMKRGACKTGHAIDRGAKKAGHAVGKVGRKAGDAVRRTGERMGGSADKARVKSDPTPR